MADESVPLVSVLYSVRRDLYRLPGEHKAWWLSTQVYDLPIIELATNDIYLGALLTDDTLGWRRAYSTSWAMIQPGDIVAVPADNVLARDYKNGVF